MKHHLNEEFVISAADAHLHDVAVVIVVLVAAATFGAVVDVVSGVNSAFFAKLIFLFVGKLFGEFWPFAEFDICTY